MLIGTGVPALFCTCSVVVTLWPGFPFRSAETGEVVISVPWPIADATAGIRNTSKISEQIALLSTFILIYCTKRKLLLEGPGANQRDSITIVCRSGGIA